MKSLVALLLVTGIVNASIAQNKTDWDEMELKGKVKSLQTKETHRYKKNGVFTPWENSYGHLTRFNNTGYRTEFSEFFGNDSLAYKITYTYKPKEKKADLAYFNKNLKPTIRKTYIHDNKGRRIEQIEYNTDGQLDHRYTYEYDDRGNLTRVGSYKKDGTLYSNTTYKYDNKDNRTDYILETPGYATSSKKFMYDAKRNIIEEFWYNGKGGIDFRFVRSYDAKGNKIQESSYKGGDKLIGTTNWTYEYDSKGNWIKKTDLTSDGTDFHTETRTIIYY